jgi:hypothetical protein
MNWGALALGGLAAGVVFLLAIYLAGKMGIEMMEMTGFPEVTSSGDSRPANVATGPNLVLVVLIPILWGVSISWLYAAIRPRFGPGFFTALWAGCFFAVLLQGTVLLSELASGVGVTATDLVVRVFFFTVCVLAAQAAASIYWETEESRHRRESGRWPTST